MYIWLCLFMLPIISGEQLIINGDFEQYDYGWTFNCDSNPLCNKNLCRDGEAKSGDYFLLLGNQDCTLQQCVQSTAATYLKFYASREAELIVEINGNLWQNGDYLDDYYQGYTKCPIEDVCCIKISSFTSINNTSFVVDKITLDQKERLTIYTFIFYFALVLLIILIATLLPLACHKLITGLGKAKLERLNSERI